MTQLVQEQVFSRAEQLAVPAENTKHSEPRILLVDDDHLFSYLMEDQALLHKLKMEVVNDAGDIGAGQVDFYDANVAIVDYDLGSWTGFQVADIISARFGAIPIVMISGTEMIDSEATANFNVHDFVHKALGVGVILASAIEAYNWWRLSRLPF